MNAFCFPNSDHTALIVLYKHVKDIDPVIGASMGLHNNSNLGEIENLPNSNALESLNTKQLKEKMKSTRLIGTSPTVRPIPNDDYVLTMEGFFKICLVVQRIQAGVPVILQGEGKTALLLYLVKNLFQNELVVFQACELNETILTKFARKIADQLPYKARQFILIQEIDNCPTSHAKELIIDRRILGKNLPDNIVVLATHSSNSTEPRSPRSITEFLWKYQTPQQLYPHL